MSPTDPKDPNATPDPNAAIAAAEEALAKAKAAAAQQAAERARAAERAMAPPPPPPLPGGPGEPPATPPAPPPPTDPLEAFAANGGAERPLIGKQARFHLSRVTIFTAIAVFLVTVAGFVWLVTDQDAKARLDATFDGNVCGEEGNQSCLTLLVTADKRQQESAWREELLRQKPIFGSLTMSYEPNDATVEIYQTRFRITAEEWKTGAKNLLGTKLCEKGPGGEDECEVPYRAFEGISNGQCVEGKVATEIPPVTGKPLVALENTFVPLFETKVDCNTGQVLEAFNYEYRVVVQHKDYDPKSVYVSRSAWTPGLGSHTLEFPPLALIPKPETMLDEFVKFRSELFCYMKKKSLEPDKVPASVVDALRTDNGFVTIELYDRTEALVLTPEHKTWWEEKWKEIEALKCDE